MIQQLSINAKNFPDKAAFIYLENGEDLERSITFAEINQLARSLARRLSGVSEEGNRALLVYQDTIEFTITFLACQVSGIIAVPVYFAKADRQQTKLRNILADCGAQLILTTLKLHKSIDQSLEMPTQSGTIKIVDTDLLLKEHDIAITDRESSQKIAFIQYTSGSTGTPKGTVVSKLNLIANQKVIQHAFGCNVDTVGLSWLPFQHDMGLIGNILHSLYVGFTCVLMSPFHFTQKPQRWLHAISKYNVTHSGGPNFAYDLCVDRIPDEALAGVDLSSWKVAFNGAEPVREHTLQRFADRFFKSGFRLSSFYPCYGLAEATLMVSGFKQREEPVVISSPVAIGTNSTENNYQAFVSSGEVPVGLTVKIWSNGSGDFCNEGEVGEVIVAGESVTQGYWNKDNSDLFLSSQGKSFLKTGDLGFLKKNNLFICGRLKEMIIVRGRNFFPHDIEQTVCVASEAIAPHSAVAFGVIVGNCEELVIVAEVKRSHLQSLDFEATVSAICASVASSFDISPADVLLLMPFSIKRTTSGKLMRLECRDSYVRNKLQIVYRSKAFSSHPSISGKDELIRKVLARSDRETIRTYLVFLFRSKYPMLYDTTVQESMDLQLFGLDSLKTMELINCINYDLGISLDPQVIYQHFNTENFVRTIESLLWIKSDAKEGAQIVL